MDIRLREIFLLSEIYLHFVQGIHHCVPDIKVIDAHVLFS